MSSQYTKRFASIYFLKQFSVIDMMILQNVIHLSVDIYKGTILKIKLQKKSSVKF